MYREFYKFSGKPFQLTPDLRFLFPSKGHKRALAYLHYGLEQGEGFVVITGQIGTGKTMLIQALLAELSDLEIATARLAAANLDADNVVPMVMAALGQQFEGKSKVALLQQMERSLRHARDYLKGVLLIVDEAQALTPAALEELRVLSNMESGGKALLQIFLVGQSELRSTLQLARMEQLRQRIVASYNLEPLSLDETKRYIGYRLVAVGWNGDPSFSPDVYPLVHHWTQGIPRKINMLMDRVLVFGFLEEVREFDMRSISKVIEEMTSELAGDLSNRLPDESFEQVESRHAPAAGTGSEADSKQRALERRLVALEAKLKSLAVDVKDDV